MSVCSNTEQGKQTFMAKDYLTYVCSWIYSQSTVEILHALILYVVGMVVEGTISKASTYNAA